MHYDAHTPVAVFLGPSLAPATARQYLSANYYPPVRMGDVYRLLATGVQTIAIVDGVFHDSTPVWQREILAALEAGIRVVGGASMGALRAAELFPYGMIGIGSVYEWYRQGRIEGDDEVALLHADAEHGYCALSEPLVNIRCTLERAVARGLLSAAQHDALLQPLIASSFHARSWAALRRAPAYTAIEPTQRTSLEGFLREERVDIKRADAWAVLAWCMEASRERPPRAAPVPWSYPGTLRTGLQCALAPDGTLVSGGEILAAAMAEDPAWAARAERAARRGFLLAHWLATCGQRPAPAVLAAYDDTALPPPGTPSAAAHARANGLTADELAAARSGRALLCWLTANAATLPGVDGAAHAALLAALPVGADGCLEAGLDACLASWAVAAGITLPAAVRESVLARWRVTHGLGEHWLPDASDARQALEARLLAAWILDHSPEYFGFAHWSAETALLRDLQLSGAAARHARALAAVSSTSVASASCP